MVCWGAQSYCRVKGVGEQRVGAARGWQSTCLQAAMRSEEGDGAGRSSRPQHSSSPQGQRLPVQRGPLEGPLPDASSQVSSGPRSPGDRARPPAPAPWGDGPSPAALTGVPTAPRESPRAFHSQFRPPWERPLPASASSGDLTNHRISSLPRKPIITRVSASVTAWQVEFGVPCLIGTSVPAVGCSRPQWVRWVVLRGWHGAWGNLARVVVSCRLGRPGRQGPSAGEGSLRLEPSRTGTLRM